MLKFILLIFIVIQSFQLLAQDSNSCNPLSMQDSVIFQQIILQAYKEKNLDTIFFVFNTSYSGSYKKAIIGTLKDGKLEGWVYNLSWKKKKPSLKKANARKRKLIGQYFVNKFFLLETEECGYSVDHPSRLLVFSRINNVCRSIFLGNGNRCNGNLEAWCNNLLFDFDQKDKNAGLISKIF